MRISDWSSDGCSSDLDDLHPGDAGRPLACGDLLGGVGSGAVALCRRLHAADRPAARLCPLWPGPRAGASRSEEHTSELQSLMRISYAVFCLKTKTFISFFLFFSSLFPYTSLSFLFYYFIFFFF